MTSSELPEGEDVLETLSEFFEAKSLDWRNLCEICTEGPLQCLGLDKTS